MASLGIRLQSQHCLLGPETKALYSSCLPLSYNIFSARKVFDRHVYYAFLILLLFQIKI